MSQGIGDIVVGPIGVLIRLVGVVVVLLRSVQRVKQAMIKVHTLIRIL